MVEVITSVDQVTAAWLTDMLTRGGALIRGSVNTVDLESAHRRLLNLASLLPRIDRRTFAQAAAEDG